MRKELEGGGEWKEVRAEWRGQTEVVPGLHACRSVYFSGFQPADLGRCEKVRAKERRDQRIALAAALRTERKGKSRSNPWLRQGCRRWDMVAETTVGLGDGQNRPAVPVLPPPEPMLCQTPILIIELILQAWIMQGSNYL